MRMHAEGSWKIAVPTLTSVAPARMSSSASGPVRTPPMPMMGTSGSASRTCQMHRTATGRLAGPESPPVVPASTGRMVAMSIAMPSKVLISESPSAPAVTQARAIATMSVTSGDSLANTGMSYRARPRTASMTAPAAPASQANTCPRSSTFGQEMLTSMAVTPAESDRRAASSAYSSTVPPAIETTARALLDSSHGRPRCRNAAVPGPCRPIEFSIPLGVSAIRGVGLPARGASITDLVTTAPILETSKNCASSRPAPADPDAVRIGFGSSAWPRRARRSEAIGPVPSPRTGGPHRGPGEPGSAAGPRFPARGAERVERDRAHVVPAHLLAAEHPAVHARPDHPREPVGADKREHARHADPDTARHQLLHRHLDRDVVPPGQQRQ